MNKKILIIIIVVIAVIIIAGIWWWMGQKIFSPRGPMPPTQAVSGDDSVAAINQDLQNVGVDNLDSQFQDIDKELNNL